MGIWAFFDAQWRDYIILFVWYLISLSVQCRSDISFCYTELPGSCIYAFKTRRLSSSAGFCCELHFLFFGFVLYFPLLGCDTKCQQVFISSDLFLKLYMSAFIKENVTWMMLFCAEWCSNLVYRLAKNSGSRNDNFRRFGCWSLSFFILFTIIPLKNVMVTYTPHATWNAHIIGIFVFASIKFSDFNYAYSNFLFLYQCLFCFLKLIKVFDNNTKI